MHPPPDERNRLNHGPNLKTMILWDQKGSHKSGDVPLKNLLINYADYMLAITDKLESFIFVINFGICISFVHICTCSCRSAIKPFPSAVENVRSFMKRARNLQSYLPRVATDIQHILKVSNKPFFAAFTSFHIRFHQNRWERLFHWILALSTPARCSIFLSPSFQNFHEIQLYRFTSSCKTTWRVVCQLVRHKTNKDVSSLFGSCKTGSIYSLFFHVKRQSRAPIIMGSMSNGQIKLCITWS